MIPVLRRRGRPSKSDMPLPQPRKFSAQPMRKIQEWRRDQAEALARMIAAEKEAR